MQLYDAGLIDRNDKDDPGNGDIYDNINNNNNNIIKSMVIIKIIIIKISMIAMMLRLL